MRAARGERCPSCGYGECREGRQSGDLASALRATAALPLLAHRYYVDMPDDQCCESMGWCSHGSVGYVRDSLTVQCGPCSEPVYGGEGSNVDLADLLNSIADHELARHSAGGKAKG